MKKKVLESGRQLPGWTPFEKTAPIPLPSDAEIARQAKLAAVSPTEMKNVLLDIMRDTIVVNSRYQVNIRRHMPRDSSSKLPTMIQLSIKRRDKQPVGKERYRDFLRIKNELVGPLHEAFEIYPSMERNVDTANQYYMWVFENPALRFPVGFVEGRMSVPMDGENSVNAPFDEGDLLWQHLNKGPAPYQMD